LLISLRSQALAMLQSRLAVASEIRSASAGVAPLDEQLSQGAGAPSIPRLKAKVPNPPQTGSDSTNTLKKIQAD
jgi:hypothetical protein